MRTRHTSGQGEFDLGGNMRAGVCRLGSRRDYSAWLEFFSPLSSRGVVVERNGVTVGPLPEHARKRLQAKVREVFGKAGPAVDLFGGAL